MPDEGLDKFLHTLSGKISEAEAQKAKEDKEKTLHVQELANILNKEISEAHDNPELEALEKTQASVVFEFADTLKSAISNDKSGQNSQKTNTSPKSPSKIRDKSEDRDEDSKDDVSPAPEISTDSDSNDNESVSEDSGDPTPDYVSELERSDSDGSDQGASAESETVELTSAAKKFIETLVTQKVRLNSENNGGGAGTGTVATQYRDGGTMYGQLTVLDVISANGGSSELWNAAYSTVNANSGVWTGGGADVSRGNSAYSSLTANSANWDNTFTTVADNSAGWAAGDTSRGNSAYATLTAVSGDWESSDTTLRANSADWAYVASNSAHSDVTRGNSAYSTLTATSASWLTSESDPIFTTWAQTYSADYENVWTVVNANSADWTAHTDASRGNSAYSSVTANSADWTSTDTTLRANSADWAYVAANSAHTDASLGNSAFTTLNSNSGDWINVESTVRSGSADWASHSDTSRGTSAYSSVTANSATWQSTHTDFSTNSGDFMNVETIMRENSANWAYVAANSAHTDASLGNSAFTTLNSNSGDWINVESTVRSGSADWASHSDTSRGTSAYSSVTANSAAWQSTHTDFSTNSGDFMNVETIMRENSANWSYVADNSAHSDVTRGNSAYSTLTATSADWESSDTTLRSNSADWAYVAANSAHSDVTRGNSAYSSVTAASADWSNVYTQVNLNSAGWEGTETTLASFSADWESTDTTVRSNSGTWSWVASNSGLTLQQVTDNGTTTTNGIDIGGVVSVSARATIRDTASAQLTVKGWGPLSQGEDGGSIQFGESQSFHGMIHYDNATSVFYIDNAYNSAAGDIRFRTKTAGTAVDAFTIDGNGRVIVYGTADLGTLTVYGHDASAITQVIRSAGSQTADIFVVENSSGTNLLAVDSNGQVGLGVDPSQKLHVHLGRIAVSDGYNIGSVNGREGLFVNQSVGTTYLQSNGTTTMYLVSGKVGINKSSPDGVLHVVSDSTSVPALTLETNEDTSAAAPIIDLCRISTTPADGDYLGQIKFKGESDTGVERVYAKITGKTSDVSNTTEDGLIEIMVRRNGSNLITSRFTGTALKLINSTGLEVTGGDITTNVTASRAVVTDASSNLSASVTTLTELGYVSGVTSAIQTQIDGKIGAVVDDTTPQLGGQLDVNGQAIGDGTRELLTFTEDASAVNHINIENQATGSGPIISAAGDDTNIDLNISAKGTGTILGGKTQLTNSSAAQLLVRGWGPDSVGNDGGAIQLGEESAFHGSISYDNASSVLYIDNAYNSNNGDIGFRTKTAGTAVTPLKLKGSGQTIINGTTTLATATIYGHDAADEALIVRAASSQTADIFEIQNSSSTQLVAVENDGKTVIGSVAADTWLHIRNNPVTDYGQVTIEGVASDDAYITVQDSAAGINTIIGTDFVSPYFHTVIANVDGGDILFQTSDTNTWASRSTQMTITSAGNVGIGTAVPDEKLSVVGNISASGFMKAHADIAIDSDRIVSITDNCKVLHLSGTSTCSFPNGLPDGFQVVVKNIGSGTITLSAQSGNLRSKGNADDLASQYGSATVYHHHGDVWHADGDLT